MLLELPLGGFVLAAPEDGRVRLVCVAELWLSGRNLWLEQARSLAGLLHSQHFSPLLDPLGMGCSPCQVTSVEDASDGALVHAQGSWHGVVDSPEAAADLVAVLAMLELELSIEEGEVATWGVT